MEEKKISDKKEVENVSIEISSEKEQTVPLPSYTKSYSQTRIESTIFEYTWKIDQFVHLSKIIDTLCSPLFPETAEYQIEMEVLRDSKSHNVTIQFYLLTTKAFTGSCTTTIQFRGSYCFSGSFSGCIPKKISLTEIMDKQYINFCESHYNSNEMLYEYIPTNTLQICCKLEIFRILTNNTIHMNLQPSSTVFSKDIRSLEDSTLDESGNKSEDEKSIKFIVGKEEYVISKKLLHATNSSYFKDVCLTHEGKEKDMTDELTDSEIDAFQEMLVFIQTGSVRSYSDYNKLKKLLTTADKYDVPTLKLTCEHYLLRMITVYNAINLIQLAFSSNAKFLETHSATFIKLYIKEVMNVKGYRNLPQESANKIMESIEKSKVLKISSDKFYSSGTR